MFFSIDYIDVVHPTLQYELTSFFLHVFNFTN